MSEGAWTRFLEHAAHARTKPTFEIEERRPKLEVAAGLRGALEAARDGGDWQALLRQALRPPTRHPLVPPRYRLVPPRQRKWLLEWADHDPESLRSSLAAFLDTSFDPVERFAGFAAAGEAAPSEGEASDERQRLRRETATNTLGSLFNFAVAPGSLPIMRAWAFTRLRELLGLAIPASDSLTGQYAAGLDFARNVRARMEAHPVAVRDMVDVQGLMTVGVNEQVLWTTEAPRDWLARGSRAVGPDTAYLTACTVYRNEAPYLPEWIEFHRLAGVERFFLYNNGSTDNHLEVLGPYLEDRTVTLHEWRPAPPDQREVYDKCLTEHRQDARWIAFLDIDEFLFSPTGTSVAELLRDYEAWPGVGVNWAMFGTSGHRTRPEGLVTESYLMSDAGETGLIKSIVDPLRTVRADSSHHFAYEYGLAVDENGWPLPGAQTKSTSFERLRINHYVSRSEEDVRAKVGRAGSWNHLAPWRMRDLEGELELVRDETIAPYVPALKAALAEVEAR
jgi:hypothetical protein